jgi:hypothetical protein
MAGGSAFASAWDAEDAEVEPHPEFTRAKQINPTAATAVAPPHLLK